MDQVDPTTLAMGTDLTTLGLNLNSPEQLYKTFASPWAERPLEPDPDFKVGHVLLCCRKGHAQSRDLNTGNGCALHFVDVFNYTDGFNCSNLCG